jgi:hypothetical protein
MGGGVTGAGIAVLLTGTARIMENKKPPGAGRRRLGEREMRARRYIRSRPRSD